MITFVTGNEKPKANDINADDEIDEIGLSQKGQPVEKIIEQAEAEAELKADTSKKEVESKIENIVENSFSIDRHTTKFHKGNLRNGMSIEFDGSIVILGDVNPGAEVRATGNILILGALKGVVHAGCKGDSNAFVFALSLVPVQLRIGGIITRFPDGDSKTNRKPEYAYVEDGKIYVSEFQ